MTRSDCVMSMTVFIMSYLDRHPLCRHTHYADSDYPLSSVNYFMSLTILSHVPPSCDQCHAPVHFDIGIRVSFNYICYHRGLYTELLYAMVFSLGYW